MQVPAPDTLGNKYFQISIVVNFRNTAIVQHHGRMLYPFQWRHFLLHLLHDPVYTLFVGNVPSGNHHIDSPFKHLADEHLFFIGLGT